MDTFREALAILRLGLDSSEEIHAVHNNAAFINSQMEGDIKKAMARLSRPQYHQAALRLHVYGADSLSPAAFQVIEHGPSLYDATIICMEPWDLEHVAHDQDPTVFESSILMHNFAVAYQCMSRVQGFASDRIDLLKAALYLQHASCNLLRVHRDDCIDYLRLSSLLHLEVIVASDCVAVLAELQEEDSAREQYSDLQDLVEWVQEGDNFWKMMDPKPVAAGAA